MTNRFQLDSSQGQDAVKCFYKRDIADLIAAEVKKVSKRSVICLNPALIGQEHIPHMLIVAGFISCASSQSNVVPEAAVLTASSSAEPAPYIIQAGDQLDIKFFYNPELNETLTVRPDGKISLQLVDEVEAAGLKSAGHVNCLGRYKTGDHFK